MMEHLTIEAHIGRDVDGRARKDVDVVGPVGAAPSVAAQSACRCIAPTDDASDIATAAGRDAHTGECGWTDLRAPAGGDVRQGAGVGHHLPRACGNRIRRRRDDNHVALPGPSALTGRLGGSSLGTKCTSHCRHVGHQRLPVGAADVDVESIDPAGREHAGVVGFGVSTVSVVIPANVKSL